MYHSQSQPACRSPGSSYSFLWFSTAETGLRWETSCLGSCPHCEFIWKGIFLFVCLFLKLFFKVWHIHSGSRGQVEVPVVSCSGSLSWRVALHTARLPFGGMFWIVKCFIILMENKGNYLNLEKMYHFHYTKSIFLFTHQYFSYFWQWLGNHTWGLVISDLAENTMVANPDLTSGASNKTTVSSV